MKFLFVFIAICSFTSVAFASDPPPPTGTAALLCKMSRHAQTTTETLSVDYDQKLVNGIPATFTASMITWVVGSGAENEHHELNRLTGTYNYWTDNKTSGEMMPTFVCAKVPVRF
jgi:hypothetical protein